MVKGAISAALFGSLVGGALVGALVTKPTKESFQKFFSEWLKQQLKSQRQTPQNKSTLGKLTSFFMDVGDSAMATIYQTMEDPVIKDYNVCSTAEVELEGRKLLFIGAFSQWYLVNVQ